ncbi:MAG: type II toxin-antitoxin system VapC family toxin [Planctomycetes bacterium]|nr:type II toxin-antitoxin system VapC family toxin [Planctomycetota bacterium]MBU4399193.1 type II toxin-antitoxin system VapC family toxin [Planctomycetota bacterium]MCG2682130.1 type II toxin-antitoxin system VapC family toxin [Planctomycetales bacterium]
MASPILSSKTVYLETTIFSSYVSQREDVASLYRSDITRQWWAMQSQAFELRTSEAVLSELRAGSYPGQQEAVELAESLESLQITDEVLSISELYVRHRLMPESTTGDALHLAVASFYEVDFLLTWNIRHLANPNKLEHLGVIDRRLGLLPPSIVTPESLWSED